MKRRGLNDMVRDRLTPLVIYRDQYFRKEAAKNLFEAICEPNFEKAQEALNTHMPKNGRILGINPTITFSGMTPFHIAAILSHKEPICASIMQRLYQEHELYDEYKTRFKDYIQHYNEYKKMPRQKDDHGYTVLHHAVMQKPQNEEESRAIYNRIKEWIEKTDAINTGEINAKSIQGYTALDILTAFLPLKFDRDNHLTSIKKLLLTQGAQCNKPVDIKTFQFPKFPKEVGEIIWQSFPSPKAMSSKAPSRQTSTGSMYRSMYTFTTYTAGPDDDVFAPPAYDKKIGLPPSQACSNLTALIQKTSDTQEASNGTFLEGLLEIRNRETNTRGTQSIGHEDRTETDTPDTQSEAWTQVSYDDGSQFEQIESIASGSDHSRSPSPHVTDVFSPSTPTARGATFATPPTSGGLSGAGGAPLPTFFQEPSKLKSEIPRNDSDEFAEEYTPQSTMPRNISDASTQSPESFQSFCQTAKTFKVK